MAMNARIVRLELDESKGNLKNNGNNKHAMALKSSTIQRELEHKTKELEKCKRMVKELNEKIKQLENEIIVHSPHKHDETANNFRVHHHKRPHVVSNYTFQQFQKAAKHKHVHAFGKKST